MHLISSLGEVTPKDETWTKDAPWGELEVGGVSARESLWDPKDGVVPPPSVGLFAKELAVLCLISSTSLEALAQSFLKAGLQLVASKQAAQLLKELKIDAKRISNMCEDLIGVNYFNTIKNRLKGMELQPLLSIMPQLLNLVSSRRRGGAADEKQAAVMSRHQKELAEKLLSFPVILQQFRAQLLLNDGEVGEIQAEATPFKKVQVPGHHKRKERCIGSSD
uniref:Uncharacterized protein n=1 Tax=Plectus sambesii TaxID=2011161 RepID=A0A914W0W2_9BILA